MFHKAQLDRIEAQLALVLVILTRQGSQTMKTIADLTAVVAANTSVEASAVAAIQGLVAEIKAAKASQDPVALDAAIAAIEANTAALAAAIPQNTVAAAPPAPAEPPPPAA